MSKIEFDNNEAFVCSNCGPTPEYLVFDGKMDGPLKRYCSHLKELDSADTDQEILKQGSISADRIFLHSQRERAHRTKGSAVS